MDFKEKIKQKLSEQKTVVLDESSNVIDTHQKPNGDRFELRKQSMNGKDDYHTIIKTHQGGKSTQNEYGGYPSIAVGSEKYVGAKWKKIKECKNESVDVKGIVASIIESRDEIATLKLAQHQHKSMMAGRQDIIARAKTYVDSYRKAGIRVDNEHWNADGSFNFTTIDSDGKITHHTFHKGGRKKVDGGHTTTNTDGVNSDDTSSQLEPEKKTRTSRTAKVDDKGKTLQDLLGIKAPRMTAKLAQARKRYKGTAQSGAQPESEEDKKIANDPAFDKLKKESVENIEEMALSAEKIGDLGFMVKWAGGKGKEKGTYFSKVHPTNPSFNAEKHLKRVDD